MFFSPRNADNNAVQDVRDYARKVKFFQYAVYIFPPQTHWFRFNVGTVFYVFIYVYLRVRNSY